MVLISSVLDESVSTRIENVSEEIDTGYFLSVMMSITCVVINIIRRTIFNRRGLENSPSQLHHYSVCATVAC